MSKSAPWSERWPRAGWRVEYTVLGGHFGSMDFDALAHVSESERLAIRRLTSQAFLAITDSVIAVDPDIEFFSNVARKIFQRGTMPLVPEQLRESIPGQDEVLASMTATEWMAAAVGTSSGPSGLDPAIRLDGAYEQALWDRVGQDMPELARFLIPQPSLEALAKSDSMTERWVDFALSVPWLDSAVVIELDGFQHLTAKAVDADRDRSLQMAGHHVSRHAGAEALDSSSELFSRLSATAERAPKAVDGHLTRLLHAPATFTRLGIAMIELLATGQLPGGGVWQLEIEDESGIAQRALPLALELLAGIGAVWSLECAPTEVRTTDATWVRHGVEYRLAAESKRKAARARICLDPFAPSYAPLPSRDPGLPTVVIRGTYLPVELPWLPSSSSLRRNVDPDGAEVTRGLVTVLRFVFGFDGFRAGQAEAVRSALVGEDSCVLLPTSAGKSLIYQLAGLLRPGVTLVVDPLTSLIDDQERRLQSDGIDRVAALHQARVASAEDRDAAYRTVASGDALFVFLTPERLQNGAFREALGRAASEQLVNLTVIDEAHCVSEWGHDFRTAYLRVGRNLRLLCRGVDDVPPPMLALTGTASPAVLRDVLRELEDPDRKKMVIQRPASFDRKNLTYQVISGDPKTWQARLREALIQEIPGGLGCEPADLLRLSAEETRSGIAFVPHVNGTYGLSSIRGKIREILRESAADLDSDVRSSIEIYSGGSPKDWTGGKKAWSAEKVRAADSFKDNVASVLVSTKAFGMGIDKPNIRWTLHVGFPSSIEAFAQEAGRAGRDDKPSRCVLIANPPPHERAAKLLDLRSSRQERLDTFNAGRHDDDLQRQLFFLTNSFQGAEIEFAHAVEMLDQLQPALPGNRVEVARDEDRVGKPGSKEQEKALYRLSMIGFVDDYTIDYGAKKFVVDLDDFSVEHIDGRMNGFISRVEPGKTALRRRELLNAPLDLRERMEHHLRLLLLTLYDVVEPARVRALSEMHQLCLLNDDEAGVRARILAYLSDGPLAGILLELADSKTIAVRKATRILDTVPAEDPREWVGSAARQLEAYPDHPLLLLVRGLGEAMLVSSDEDTVRESFHAAFRAMESYGVSGVDAAWLFGWASAQLRNQQEGRGWAHVPLLYGAWAEAGLDDEELIELEDRVLAMVETGQFHTGELHAVLVRRLRRRANEVQEFTTERTAKTGSL